MDCSMRIDSSGYMYICKGHECAWWDRTNQQCSVKSFLLKNTQTPEENKPNYSNIWGNQ